MPADAGSFDHIPVVDLAPLESGDEGCKGIASALDDAFANVGFAYVVNHGVPSPVIDNLFSASLAFHALPMEDKMDIELNRFHRGYMPFNSSTTRTSSVAEVDRPNQSESFIMLHDLADDDPDVLQGVDLAGPNQWPRRLQGFREAVCSYNGAMTILARRLVEVIALALGRSTGYLLPHFEQPTTFLRLLHYPPHPVDAPEGVFGSAPHTDYGFLTLVSQDDAGGLQVRNTEGDWIDAPPRAGAFVMNVGDILHRWSNGRFISTPHRVLNRSGRERYSCPFFFDPNMHSLIEPVTGVEGGSHARYQPVVYGRYLMERIWANHDQHVDRGVRVS